MLWRVLDVLVAHGLRLEVARTTHAGHAASLAREAASRGAPLVVAAGGDGTIAEVSAGLAGSQTALGIVPLGTANVLAHELGIPFAARDCAATLAFGRSRLLWPGIVASPSGGRRLFVQMCGVGFDAAVVQRLPPALKRRAGRSAFVLQSLREMVRYKFAPLTVRIDGTEARAASAVITKGRYYAGPYMLAPEARPAEPGFQVALFGLPGPLSGPAGATLYGAALLLNRLPRAPGVRLLRGAEIEIDAPVPVQTDGESAGAAPLRITSAPEPIRVVVG